MLTKEDIESSVAESVSDFFSMDGTDEILETVSPTQLAKMFYRAVMEELT